MIHFDFIVEDDEAECILDAVEDQIRISTYELMFGHPTQMEWHRARIAFMKELKAKMTNSIVS